MARGEEETLLCWRSDQHGDEVLANAVARLAEQKVAIRRVLYVVQTDRLRRSSPPPEQVGTARVELVKLTLADPTHHVEIQRVLEQDVLPLVAAARRLHVNISPGTPAMHAVWLVLYAGGALPEGTRIWSSQKVDGKTRIDPVDYAFTTYLARVRRFTKPDEPASFDPGEALSPRRREALERLCLYARIPDAPLLVIGERGTGKTRLVERLVAPLKGRKKVVTVPCGSLQPSLADAELFGHSKGAFTGAAQARVGLIGQADGGVLFLDEVQDLPPEVQRKLVRFLQDRRRRYRRVGEEREQEADVEVVCASNLPLSVLRSENLDADLFDRVGQLVVTLPPLRDCREDLPQDWHRVWRELRRLDGVEDAPSTPDLEQTLAKHELPGNLRDLQRLAWLVQARLAERSRSAPESVALALRDWEAVAEVPTSGPVHGNGSDLGTGTRDQRVASFRGALARWAHERYRTWKRAAEALGCDERTLREDAKLGDGERG